MCIAFFLTLQTTFPFPLSGISGERIWSELQKILTGRLAPHLMAVITQCGLTSLCGLPTQLNIERFDKAFSRTGEGRLHAAAALGCLLTTEDDVSPTDSRENSVYLLLSLGYSDLLGRNFAKVWLESCNLKY